MNNQLELVQIVPDTYLPVQMIVAKLREQLRMYETTRQLRQTGGRRVLR